MVTPTTSRLITSAMMTAVNILRPISSFSSPLSDKTLATMPRLDNERMPARQSALVNSRLRAKSTPRKSEVTSRETRTEMTTDRAPAMKKRPRIVAMKPGMSISSRPIRKKRTKTPMPRKISISLVGSTIPATGPSRTPARV